MEYFETNIFPIENLDELNCKYRTYKIRGVPESEDYYKNIRFLVDRLSRMTKSPCELLSSGQNILIAQPEGYPELPKEIKLVRTSAKIEKLPQLHDLNFSSLTPDTEKLATRFLQFSLQSPLFTNPSLWQPQTGYPFYQKIPDPDFSKLSRSIDLYRGFTFRIANLLNGRLGICIDARSKYVSRFPLLTKISRREFKEKYQGQRCVYEYGKMWYEIKLEAYNSLNVSEVKLPDGLSLYDNVHKKAGYRKSRNLLALPTNCTVLVYYTSLREPRYVPSGLCRLTYGTNHPDIRSFHRKTLLSPLSRREEIRFIVDKYFRNLSFGKTKIILSKTPVKVDDKIIQIPDLKFGNNTILSVRDTFGSIPISIDEFPTMKRELLYQKNAGLFTKKPFDRQYIILPRSIAESFGDTFIEDIKNQVQRLCPQSEGMIYSPIPISYNDSIHVSAHSLAKEIMKTVEENDVRHGFGIVMIPRLPYKAREEDQLANYLERTLRKKGVYVSVIHTEVPEESYIDTSFKDGVESWTIVSNRRQRGRFIGYLRNVVLNKILITNNIWPFVLNTPLNADLTIGIDVKNKTAGFTIIYKSGEEIRFLSSQSNQREQLSRKHMSIKIYEILKEEKELLSKEIRKIAIHRQGILFPSERAGIINALERLKREQLLSNNYQCTFAEIKTTSVIHFRLFNVITPPGRQKEKVLNPPVGLYYPLSESTAFLCTTGLPYKFAGTAIPITVIKVQGEMPQGEVVEDVFYLSNLTWTKIDDCSRLPLSVKMNDIRLREIAGDFDPDAFKYVEEEEK